MNVEQLINILQDLDPQTPVILSSDPEGNSFAGLGDFSIEHVEKDYRGEQLDAGELFILDPDDEDEYDEVDISTRFKKVVILWP